MNSMRICKLLSCYTHAVGGSNVSNIPLRQFCVTRIKPLSEAVIIGVLVVSAGTAPFQVRGVIIFLIAILMINLRRL